VDDEDLDGDGIPGFADGFDLDGVPGNADDEYEDELMPLYQLVLSFPTNVGDTPPKIWLEYSAPRTRARWRPIRRGRTRRSCCRRRV
jgi:hypothetical protein